MTFQETPLPGAYVIHLEPTRDERGFFARSYCEHELMAHGVDFHTVQCNIVWNEHRGTLRGMHYQAPPHAEAKLVRCIKGAIYDVIIDLRTSSPTFRKWFAIELSSDNRTMLFVPQNFAHGVLTLADDTELFYQMSSSYQPGYARGIRWDDPTFNIAWPDVPRVMSLKDRQHPDFKP